MKAIDSNTAEKIKSITRISLAAIVLTAILMFSFGKVDAQNGQKDQRQAVQREITKMLHYPVDIMTEIPNEYREDVAVQVGLQIDDAGQIKVDEVYSGSQLLSDYVKEELKDKRIENMGLSNTGVYQFIIHFKTI